MTESSHSACLFVFIFVCVCVCGTIHVCIDVSVCLDATEYHAALFGFGGMCGHDSKEAICSWSSAEISISP